MPRDLLLFGLSLSALGLAFPPFRLGFFACWALIPFLLLLEEKSAGTAFRWGYGAGLVANMIAMQASFLMPSLERLLAVLVFPVSYGILAVLLAQLHRAWPSRYLIGVPFLWTMMEYAQAHAAPPGLASLTLGYTQEYYINLLRHASSENIFLISFWVVAINVLLLALWRHRENLLWLSLLSVLLLVLLVLPFVFTKMVSRDSNLFHEKLLEVHRVLLPREAPGVTGTSAASAGTFCRFKFISMGL